jgi:putative oxidoreductase
MSFRKSITRQDYGLLVLRLGIGIMYVTVHAYPKIAGGVQTWLGLGRTFGNLIGVTFWPVFWGLMASISEFVGGMCLITGVMFRPACAAMLFTMSVAVLMNLKGGYGFSGASEAFELGTVLVGLIIIGTGKITLTNTLTSRKRTD